MSDSNKAKFEFRGKENDTWVYGGYYFNQEDSSHNIIDEKGMHPVDYDTVGMFINVMEKDEEDRPGAKIYQGDIVCCNRYENSENHIVVIKDIVNLPRELFGSSLNSRKILGNIFEDTDTAKMIRKNM